MIEKTCGIVLRQYKYNDSSIVVQMYTRDFGRLSFHVNIPKTKKGKIKPGFFQPLFLLDLEVDIKPKRELQRIREVNLSPPLNDIPYHTSKNAIAQFLSEVLSKVLIEESKNHELFDYLLNSIMFFDLLEDNISDFHLYFLIRLTKYLGFAPEFNNKTAMNYLDLQEGKFSMVKPIHNMIIEGDQLEYFKSCLNMSMDKIQGNTRINRSQILEQIINYYNIHILNFSELKSLAILKEVFNQPLSQK